MALDAFVLKVICGGSGEVAGIVALEVLPRLALIAAYRLRVSMSKFADAFYGVGLFGTRVCSDERTLKIVWIWRIGRVLTLRDRR